MAACSMVNDAFLKEGEGKRNSHVGVLTHMPYQGTGVYITSYSSGSTALDFKLYRDN